MPARAAAGAGILGAGGREGHTAMSATSGTPEVPAARIEALDVSLPYDPPSVSPWQPGSCSAPGG